LYAHTKDARYLLAIQAMEFAFKKKEYPGSHHIEFDKKLYEEFKREVQINEGLPRDCRI